MGEWIFYPFGLHFYHFENVINKRSFPEYLFFRMNDFLCINRSSLLSAQRVNVPFGKGAFEWKTQNEADDEKDSTCVDFGCRLFYSFGW